jgi:hypothetical protein
MPNSERKAIAAKAVPSAAAVRAGSVPGGAEPDLAALEACDLPDLRAAWRRLHRGATPPSLSRDLLLRDVAFRLQEIAFGGLRPAAKRKLAALSTRNEQQAGTVSVVEDPDVRMEPGAGAAAGADGENTGCSRDAVAPASLPALAVAGARPRDRSATRTVTIQLKPGATLMRA